jgi:protein-S-isoprenylcysteine O-methyltransferase Ste14
MPVWLPAVLYLASTVAMMVVRAPHIRRSLSVRVVLRRVGPLERVLVTLVLFGMLLLPLAWIATPWLDGFARAAPPSTLVLGTLTALAGLWLLHRSHVDLGVNWSTTLEIRDRHALVTDGVYRRIRHPMYAAFLVHALGQALIVPNWIAGPSYLLSFALLVAFRLGPEERMLREVFGPSFDSYRTRTSRLVPGVF